MSSVIPLPAEWRGRGLRGGVKRNCHPLPTLPTRGMAKQRQMSKEAVLMIIKPDGLNKQLAGEILSKFAKANLQILAARLTRATRKQAEEHYQHIKHMPFFKNTVGLLMGEFHRQKEILLIVYYGAGAIRKCRDIAGATNPQDASPQSVRGLYGRVTNGVFENVVHVSSSKKDAAHEIKLWFKPNEIMNDSVKKRIWK